MSSESTILHDVSLAVVKIPGVRLWRANTGAGYPASRVGMAVRALWKGDARAALEILNHTRPVHYGVTGQADLSGIVGPEGWRLEIECKTEKGKQREEQRRYQAMIGEHGGIYLLARNAETAKADLERLLQQRRQCATRT